MTTPRLITDRCEHCGHVESAHVPITDNGAFAPGLYCVALGAPGEGCDCYDDSSADMRGCGVDG